MSNDNTFITEPIDLIPDLHTEYYCSLMTKASGFTYLMKLVLITNHNVDAFNVLKSYIKNNQSEINKQNSKGWTALILASRNSARDSTPETVKLLLEHGADINMCTSEYSTALILASRNSNTTSNNETVKLLLEHKADVTRETKSGWDAMALAMHYCCEFSNIGTVELLLEYGANVSLEKLYKISTPEIIEIIMNKKPFFFFDANNVKYLNRYLKSVNAQNSEKNLNITKMALQKGYKLDIEHIKKNINNCVNEIDNYLHDQTFMTKVLMYLDNNNFKYILNKYNNYVTNKDRIAEIPQKRNEIYWKPNNIISLCAEQSFNAKNNIKSTNSKFELLFDGKIDIYSYHLE